MANSREQQLVDIAFQLVLTALDSPAIKKKSTPERAQWVAEQLAACGFPTKPVGSSWGVLTDPASPPRG